ncbi:MAG: SH3 domain-containing protein, partial [Brevundimonas sp.]
MKLSPKNVAIAATILSLSLPGLAEAQNRRSGAQLTQDQQMANIPRCTTNLGSITIADGQSS